MLCGMLCSCHLSQELRTGSTLTVYWRRWRVSVLGGRRKCLLMPGLAVSPWRRHRFVDTCYCWSWIPLRKWSAALIRRRRHVEKVVWHVRRIQQWRWLQCVSFPPQLTSPLFTLHPWKGIQSLPPLLRCVGWKTWLRIFNISLQEAYLHWPVSTLPPQTENQFNWYSVTQGFHDLFKRQTRPRAWQNPFNPIGKLLSGKFNPLKPSPPW